MTTDIDLDDWEDPDQEVELGDIDARMDDMQDELDHLDDQQELENAIDGNVLADERQLDEP